MAHRTLPRGLRNQAAGRSKAAKEALQEAMAAWWSELEENGFDTEALPTLKDVQLRAGLGEKFLYGPKHKKTTKVWVENWIERVRNHININKIGSYKNIDDAVYWKNRYEKLAKHANLWFLRMRQLQKRIKDLEKRCEGFPVKTSDVDQ